LRRSLLNDIIQIRVVAVELEGAIHEFSRLPGLHEPVLDLLFRFRKLTFRNSSFLKSYEKMIVPFSFFGPGTFYRKDVVWPVEIQCRRPKDLLVTLSPGSFLCGRFLIQKNCRSNFTKQINQSLYLGQPLRVEYFDNGFLKQSKYPWLGLGITSGPVERVGFRIESIASFNYAREILVFEILTDGSLSPRNAFYEAVIVLVYKFSSIANLILPATKIKVDTSVNINRQVFYIELFSSTGSKTMNQKESERIFYRLFNTGFSDYQVPFNLDLRNLDLGKKGYNELRNLGFQTLGQVIERLISDSYSLPYILEIQRQQAMLRFGISSLF
jgi:DNA-directed RNA polymerase alpha subunit